MHNKKPRTLSGTGLICCSRVLKCNRTQIDSAIVFFAELKTKVLIYQCFCFAVSAKNGILGSLMLRSAHNSDKLRFNASFSLQPR